MNRLALTIKLLFRSLICLITLLMFSTLKAQQEDYYQQEVNRMVRIPNSPEAQAFAKYGETDVSLYAGTPNIAIPLHTIGGREMNLPFSLTYDATGVKVEQQSTWVGLSWNLNVGGRISRSQNGLPDDFIQGDYLTMTDPAIQAKVAGYLANTTNPKQFATQQEVIDYFHFLRDINLSFIDAQPDVFNLNAPGLNGTIVFDINDNFTPKVLDNPRIKITAVRDVNYGKAITQWIVTNEDGSKYYFDILENTLRQGNDYTNAYHTGNPGGAIINEYTSSWLLRKIESVNKKDIYEFTYDDQGYWSQPQLGSSATMATTQLIENVYHYTQPYIINGTGTGYFIAQQLLSTVKHNGSQVATFTRGLRHDVDNNALNTRLANIIFYDHKGGLLKKVNLLNDAYFGFSSGDITQENPFDIRLKLEGVEILGKDNGTYETYSFDYVDPDNLPSRTSLKQDFAGYYNGKNNQVLYPYYENGPYTFEGANRDPDFGFAQKGLLNKITYPTKGSTIFQFEGNYKAVNVQNQINRVYLNNSVTGNDPLDPNLYLRDDGSLCDDRYGFTDSSPIIKVVNFDIVDAGNYKITFAGTALNEDTEAKIVYRGPYDFSCTGPCPQPPVFERLCDFDYAAAEHVFWNSSNYITVNSKNFPAGKYAALVVLDEEGAATSTTYRSSYLTVSRLETVTSVQSTEQGGVRIANIKNYDDDGTFISGKKYSYSDANVNYRPNLVNPQEDLITRTVSYPTGSEPIAVYDYVNEYRINASGQSEGYTRHTFYHESKGMVPRLTPPFENNYFPSLRGGNLKNQIITDQSGGQTSKKEVDYFETYDRPISVKGMVITTNKENIGNFVYIKKLGTNGPYTYDLLPGNECSGGTASPTYGVVFCSVFPCGGNLAACGYETWMSNEYGGLEFRQTFINGAYGGVSVTRDTLYLKDDTGNPMALGTKDSLVYETNYFRPRKSISQKSNGDIVESTSYYADDKSISSLMLKNNLAEVVESETHLVDSQGNQIRLLSAQKKDYSSYNGGAVVMPTKISNSLLNGTPPQFEERVEFTFYSNGNLKESKQKDGPTTTYIWGYDSRYLIAKLENATYSQVSSYVGNLQNLSNQDIDRTIGSAGSEGALRSSLNSLRDQVSGALITTYTYDPDVGVTSITDPMGQVIYYDYDDFNRLKQVKDQSGYLISENKYHYQGQN